MPTLDELTQAITAYGDQRFTAGKIVQKATDDASISELVSQVTSLSQELTAANAQVGQLEDEVLDITTEFAAYRLAHPDDTTPPPTPDAKLRIGVYSSGNNAGTDSYTSSWSKKPNTGTFYMNWGGQFPDLTKASQTGAAGIMRKWAAEGRSLSVVLATKISTGVYQTWTDISAGKLDARLVEVVKSLESLGVEVDLCLDCEPDAQYDAKTDAGGGLPGVKPGQTPAQYVAAANKLGDVIAANSPSGRIGLGVWLAGFKSASITTSFLPAKSKLKHIGWDPYKTVTHPATETAKDLFSKVLNTVILPAGYTTQKYHIHETGIQIEAGTNGVTWTPAQQKAFFASIPQAMRDLKIVSVVWFRANSGNHQYIPTDPSVDTAFAQMVATATA